MKLNSKIALSMLILLGLGCAKKKSNSNNDAPKTSTESSAASAPLPNPEPKTMPEVVENAKAAAAEVSEAAEAVIEEVKKAPEAPGKNSTKDDDITKLTELKNATDAVKNEDPKKLDETISNPKLDALSWDLLMNQSFNNLGQEIKKAFDDAGQEIKNTFENDVNRTLQTADKEAHDALDQSVGDLPVPGVGNVPVSIGMLAGGSIIVVSAAVGLGSYFKDRSPLTKEQKKLIKDFRYAESTLADLKNIPDSWLETQQNGTRKFKYSVANDNSKFTKFKKKNKIGTQYAAPHEKPILTVEELNERLRSISSKTMDELKIYKTDYAEFLDQKGERFLTQEEFVTKYVKDAWFKKIADTKYNKTINSKGTVFIDPKSGLRITENQLRKEIDRYKPTNNNESDFIEQQKSNAKEKYSFLKTKGIRPNEKFADVQVRLKTTPKPRSTLNKLGIGGGLAGMLAGGGLMAYTQLGGNMFGLAESEARTRLKKALEALSEVESQLWEVREAQGIGE